MPSTPFSGFQRAKDATVSLYDVFFVEVLPLIDDLDELKVTLYALRAISQREGVMRYLVIEDFTGVLTPERIAAALNRAVARGTLLMRTIDTKGSERPLYFVNDDDGRAAAGQVETVQYRALQGERPVEILPPRPTIYALYEQNIGPLTPMISEELIAAGRDFPETWIVEAFRIASTSNKRNWRYVRAILDRWQKEGKQPYETAPRPDADAERRIARDLSDFIVQ